MKVFTAQVQRRWVDLDAQGHANNTQVVDYLQEARTQFLLGGCPRLLLDGCVVVATRVEFLHPITYRPTPIQCEVSVSEIGAARFVLQYVLTAEDQVAGRATTELCPYDFKAATPRRLSDAERAFLQEYHAEPLQLRATTAVELAGRGEPYEFLVRWSDLDCFGHVNNIRCFDYIQEARIFTMSMADPIMARVGTPWWVPGNDPDVGTITWLLARQDIEYLAQIKHRLEPYVVLSAPTRIGTSSLTFTAEVVEPNRPTQVYARATAILVSGDRDAHPIPLPERVRTAMAARFVE